MNEDIWNKQFSLLFIEARCTIVHTGFGLPFAACEIDQVELGRAYVFLPRSVLLAALQVNAEDGMTP